MKLNHLNLTVTDVVAAHNFLQTYFGMTPLTEPDPNMGFLTDENGMVLSLFRGKEMHYPKLFHIGFIQASRAKVDDLNARLKADGYDVPAPSHQHGSWTFYMEAPGGFAVEVLS